MYMESTAVPSVYTRERHPLSIDTVAALAAAKNGKTWRGLAESLGYPKTYAATLHKVAHGIPGTLTWRSENILRRRLGLSPCPFPQIVSGKPRNRKRYHRPCMDDAEYARFLEWRSTQ